MLSDYLFSCAVYKFTYLLTYLLPSVVQAEIEFIKVEYHDSTSTLMYFVVCGV